MSPLLFSIQILHIVATVRWTERDLAWETTLMRRTVANTVKFPPAWVWWADEAIPNWVKNNYSPNESWKAKPFSKEDALFFSKGVLELSEIFTEDRPRNLPAYFNHPKFRSSYLLYFLPLQAAKFYALYCQYPQAMEAMLAHGKKQGRIRITDVGAGPGTATLAALLWLLQHPERDLPPIELEWIDLQRHILLDGEALALQLAESFPKLRGKVTVKKRIGNWWQSRPEAPSSLLLFGNVLNESTGMRDAIERLLPWLESASGAGALFVEPAARISSQRLSQIRDQWSANHETPPTASTLWGPCLHAEGCPLSQGRDWCHFSIPVEIPGEWFKFFSKALGSERHWLKYSYLWLTAPDYPAPIPAPRLRRVISDLLGRGPGSEVLLCEPNEPRHYLPPPIPTLHRGDIITPIEDRGDAPALAPQMKKAKVIIKK